MTLRMYAERKGLALQSVAVQLSHERIHARDCEDCETKKGMLDVIHSKIHLKGDLDEAQRKRLLELPLAVRCIARLPRKSRFGPLKSNRP